MKLEKLLFLLLLFFEYSSSSSSSGIQWWMLAFIVPTRVWGSVHFFLLFFSVVQLFKFNGLLKFTDSILSFLSNLRRSGKIFIFVLQLYHFHWLFFVISFLLKMSIFSFVTRGFIIGCWCIFMTTAFKSLSGNSQHQNSSLLVSVDCLFSFKLWFSLFLM